MEGCNKCQEDLAVDNATKLQDGLKKDDDTLVLTEVPPKKGVDVQDPIKSPEIGESTATAKEKTEGEQTIPQKSKPRRASEPINSTNLQSGMEVQQKTSSVVVVASTMCQEQQDIGATTAPKRPRTPSPSSSPETHAAHILELQREYVFDNMVRSLQKAWHHMLDTHKPTGIGPEGETQLRYESNVKDIRSKVMKPGLTLEGIADETISVAIRLWLELCYRFIHNDHKGTPYLLVSKAEGEAKKIKKKALNNVSRVRDTSPHFSPMQYSPSLPPPSPREDSDIMLMETRPYRRTPRSSNSPLVDSLRPGVERLSINRRSNQRSGERDNRYDLRRTPTPAPSYMRDAKIKRRKIAEHDSPPAGGVRKYGSPGYGNSPRGRPPKQRDNDSPKRGRGRPRKPRVVEGESLVGCIGPYAVINSPARTAGQAVD
ncbi:uncharacterized protein F4822DRAFT_117446 [Hypoxylon trugodes]|uniref:uncharacterized protein n=1 Tax=Hypoxylon trugodes TaxID=326681 RepID=UPI00218F20C9|nr:uncharacterized protein F4822DRAFT_117446 [Hypoxylon trugodes]KAI1392165.1 hypothetical protein F4822DRAFT_117446 [Hypoxylon trugodes]